MVETGRELVGPAACGNCRNGPGRNVFRGCFVIDDALMPSKKCANCHRHGGVPCVRPAGARWVVSAVVIPAPAAPPAPPPAPPPAASVLPSWEFPAPVPVPGPGDRAAGLSLEARVRRFLDWVQPP